MIASLLLALLPASVVSIAFSQPQYSCQSCNLITFLLNGPALLTATSTCVPMTCDSNINNGVGSLSGPTCLSPWGYILTCNNTINHNSDIFDLGDTPGIYNQTYQCNCDQGVTPRPPYQAATQPQTCTLPSDQQGLTCMVNSTFESCSFFDSIGNFQCKTLLPPTGSDPPQKRYDSYGLALQCDGSPHPRVAGSAVQGTQYMCSCDGGLDASTVNSIKQSSNSIQLFDCPASKLSDQLIVDVQTALSDIVQGGPVNLPPVAQTFGSEV